MYTISTEVLARIDALVASGPFASRDEVVREAIDALMRREGDLAVIREGIADFEAGRYVSLEEFAAEMQDKYDFLRDS